MFFLLGFLNEYNGRNIVEDSDLIEHFYCNEAAAAETFEAASRRLANEQGIDPQIRREKIQGCLQAVFSLPR